MQWESLAYGWDTWGALIYNMLLRTQSCPTAGRESPKLGLGKQGRDDRRQGVLQPSSDNLVVNSTYLSHSIARITVIVENVIHSHKVSNPLFSPALPQFFLIPNYSSVSFLNPQSTLGAACMHTDVGLCTGTGAIRDHTPEETVSPSPSSCQLQQPFSSDGMP